MEEWMKFTLLTRDVAPYLADRYSERKESAEALSRRVQQAAIRERVYDLRSKMRALLP